SEEMKKAMETGADIAVEFRIITAKNNIKIVHSILRVIRNKDGKAMKFAGSIRDVTDQRSLEQSRKEKAEGLHHGTKELEGLGYFASHDRREPLRKITA